MFRRKFLMLQVLTPLALCAGLVATPSAQADGPAKGGGSKQVAADIKKAGKLPGGAGYWQAAQARHGAAKKTVQARAMLQAKGANGKATLAAGGRSSLTVVGGEGLPDGFGKGFSWDRAEDEALLVMFVNAADPLGVSIEGLQPGDQVQVLSASGVASFSEDKGNPLASSIVGLVATGASIGLTAAGAPEVVPLVSAAEAFAKDRFKATNAKTKKRDAFGVDPGSGHKAREEGGVLVCLPEAGGTYYSGDDDHKNRWVQGSGLRTDDKMPQHVYGSFFPRQAEPVHNTRTVRQGGPMYVVPWDWKFEDNAGFYKVFVKLKKGNGSQPPVILRKSGPQTQAKPKVKR
jgi:hypothetical protein